MNENEHLIELIATHTKTLLQNHWSDITAFRNDGNGDSIKVGFSHDLTYEGQERIIESTISLGKRIKDSTTDRVDTQQLNFELTGKREKKPTKKKITEFPQEQQDAQPAEAGT